jgi:hypothetical protein
MRVTVPPQRQHTGSAWKTVVALALLGASVLWLASALLVGWVTQD